MKKTALSVGEIVYKLLTQNKELAKKVTKIFPVVTNVATLPYVAYRRSAYVQDPTKSRSGAETVVFEVNCYAETYEESMQIAEMVRTTLDHVYTIGEELNIKACTLTGCEEIWSNDAFTQHLSFTIKT